MIRILMADDHSMVRQGIRELLEHETDFEIVGEASNGKEAVDLAEKLIPDVVLMDISMPEVNGLTATRQIKERSPGIQVLGLTMYEDDEYVLGLLESGATGYVLKKAFGKDLIRAIRAVEAGEFVFNSTIGRKLIEHAVRQEVEPAIISDIDKLTPRELQILNLVSEGLSNQAIARETGIEVVTVKSHMANIFSKMNVKSRTEAVFRALKLGLVNLDERRSGGASCDDGIQTFTGRNQ